MKMNNYLQDFLSEGGYELGYSENDLPNLGDMKKVLKDGITIWKYYQVTERQYYAGKKVPR
jgi:hypothetical protein